MQHSLASRPSQSPIRCVRVHIASTPSAGSGGPGTESRAVAEAVDQEHWDHHQLDVAVVDLVAAAVDPFVDGVVAAAAAVGAVVAFAVDAAAVHPCQSASRLAVAVVAYQ